MYSELAGCCAVGKSLGTLLYCLSVHNSQCIELMSKYIVGSMNQLVASKCNYS